MTNTNLASGFSVYVDDHDSVGLYLRHTPLGGCFIM